MIKVWEVADPTPAYRHDRPIESISSPPDGRGLAVDDVLWEVGPDAGPDRLRPLPRPVPADFFSYVGMGSLYAARLRKFSYSGFFYMGSRFSPVLPDGSGKEVTIKRMEQSNPDLAVGAAVSCPVLDHKGAVGRRHLRVRRSTHLPSARTASSRPFSGSARRRMARTWPMWENKSNSGT